jgi:transketolase
VINIHTIKPIDRAAILASVGKTGCAVSAEEHNVLGGLGESIAGVLAQHHPAPLELVGTMDTFGESGDPADLMKKYGLDAGAIVKKALKAISRKK